MLDDDEDQIQARIRADEAVRRNKPRATARDLLDGLKRRVTGGQRVYEGDRRIAINEPHANLAAKWPGNSVSTSKYNIVTFLPKFLIGKSPFFAVLLAPSSISVS